MTVLDRFLKYVTFDTQSNEETGTTPSTPGQRVFAEALVKELEAIGMEEISSIPIASNSFTKASAKTRCPGVLGVVPVSSFDWVSNVTYFKNLSKTVITHSFKTAIKVDKASYMTKK